MKEIVLKCGSVCLVDDEDFEVLSKKKWRLAGSGYPARNQHDPETGKQSSVYMHRVVTNAQKGTEVDHINLNKLDNRKENLKVCTRIENCRKRPKCKRDKHSQSSTYKGVSLHSNGSGRYRARIFFDGKEISLGLFNTEVEAAMAYNNAAEVYFKEYAVLNKIKEA